MAARREEAKPGEVGEKECLLASAASVSDKRTFEELAAVVDCCILESVGSKPMNNLYFACTSCKVFVDAGYRWAYCTLEEVGAVKRGEIVQPGSVLAAEEYWTPEPGENSKWLLEEVLPSIRSFLQEHGTHRIVFDEGDVFYETGPDWFLEWIQVGYLADPLPRFSSGDA